MSNVVNRFWPKEVWIGWFSSAMEAYNMAIYSFAAPFLAGRLFSSESSDVALFFSYALVLIASGIFYPLGAFYFGQMGDREGRQKICVSSTFGLALATGLMGLLPFGELTWLGFLLLICAQYFFSGGEYYSSIVFSLEHGQSPRGGMMSALSCLFAVFGLAAANGLANVSFSLEALTALRFSFIFGGLGGGLSYLLKYTCCETPPFAALSKQPLIPWRSFLKEKGVKIALGVLFSAFFLVTYNFIFIFLPLLPNMSGQAFDTFKSLLAYGVFLTLSGVLADRFGLKKVILAGMVLFAILALPATLFLKNLLLLQLLLTFCACLSIAPLHSWLMEQFSIQHRCRGVFWSSAIATSLFCGSTTPLCLKLYEMTQSLPVCALYPSFIALCAISLYIWFSQRSEPAHNLAKTV